MHIIIERDVPEEIAKNPTHLSPAEKNKKIDPLKLILESCGKLDITPFFNKPARRAGLNVYCSNPMDIEKFYLQISDIYLDMIHYGQLHQVELERELTF